MNASAKSIYDYDNGVSAELRGLAQAFMSKDGGESTIFIWKKRALISFIESN